jgi:hypothetical protein
VVLQREVEGYREAAARLERGEPVLPKEDVAIAISDALVRDLIGAQLPFEADVDKFHISLRTAEVKFRGSPVVELSGALNLKNRPKDISFIIDQLTINGALRLPENVAQAISGTRKMPRITLPITGVPSPLVSIK